MAMTVGGSNGVTYPSGSNLPAGCVTSALGPAVTDTTNIMTIGAPNKGANNGRVIIDGTNGLYANNNLYTSGGVNLSYTFASNTANAALNVTSISGYIAGLSNITVTVNSGVYLWSNSTLTPGLTLTGGSTGDTITLVNNGYIMGQGGNGGNASNGLAGGTALSIGYNISLTNNSYIGGGGGGGGAGFSSSGGGGAGGGTGGTYAGTSGGAGGSIGASGGNGNLLSCSCCCAATTGGGGGRIFPGTGGLGASGLGNVAPILPTGGGAGGGGGGYSCAHGGNGGSSNNSGASSSGGANKAFASGGGGGWGASGGSSTGNKTGGTGGNAIALNGHTITYITTGNVWGAVA